MSTKSIPLTFAFTLLLAIADTALADVHYVDVTTQQFYRLSQ